MNSMPLHPLFVHLPIALAALLPLIAGGLGWAVWTGRRPRRAWAALVALQLLLMAATFVALKTGEREEERVESVVPEPALNQHEAYAEQFAWATVVVGGLGMVGLVGARRLRQAAVLLTVAGTLGQTLLAVRVGHAGGSLVYRYGAASAYTGSQSQRQNGERQKQERRKKKEETRKKKQESETARSEAPMAEGRHPTAARR